MIISRTPYRISFFGGGTDYPAWYRQHGGRVLATTINKYCYISCRYLPPFFDHRYRVVYSKTEEVADIGAIAHPAARTILQHMKFVHGLEIHHDGDLPARSGIGSSSAFVVGMIHALSALRGRMVSKDFLSKEAMYVEQECLKEIVGCQDQILSAQGGLNVIVFETSGETSVRRLIITPERAKELTDHLMLFFTGIKRTASQVAKSYANNVGENHQHLRLISDMVGEGIRILTNGDLQDFGKLLHEAWQVKRRLGAHISNSQVDEIYARALRAGALGGKLMGAGGGGFMLLFVPPALRTTVRQALSDLLYVPFNFESEGSQIIFYDPEEDYLTLEHYNAASGH